MTWERVRSVWEFRCGHCDRTWEVDGGAGETPPPGQMLTIGPASLSGGQVCVQQNVCPECVQLPLAELVGVVVTDGIIAKLAEMGGS